MNHNTGMRMGLQRARGTFAIVTLYFSALVTLLAFSSPQGMLSQSGPPTGDPLRGNGSCSSSTGRRNEKEISEDSLWS